MIKNNRGFVATAVLYSLAVLLAIILFLVLKNLSTTRQIERGTAYDIKGDILYYEIAYNGTTATGGEMRNSRMSSGEEVALTANAYVMDGYTFKGWAMEPNGPVLYEDGQKVKDLVGINEKITLFAVWGS